MEIELLYFDGCPHLPVAVERLEALRAEFVDLEVTRREVTSEDDAERLGFHGSPSFHLDGSDLFDPPAGTQPGMSCRLYETGDSVAGAPTIDELRTAIAARLGRLGAG